MEYMYYSIRLLLAIITILFFSKSSSKSNSRLPPGPRPWPIIGNIHKLSDKPHRAVTELSKFYGPIMSLKLGSITTIVISSSEIAQEMFLKHDLDFSSKAVLDATRACNHNKFSIVFLPICPQWRNLRKISTVQLFTTQRLDSSQVIRHNKVNELVDYIQLCGKRGEPVDIGKAAFTTTLNLLSTTFFSMDLASHSSSSSQEFKELVWHLLEEGAKPNVSDFFLLLKIFDLQEVLRRATTYAKQMLRIFEEIIDERLRDPQNMGAKDDVLNTLLKLFEEQQLSLDDIKHLLLALFLAGTDTTSTTVEWTMTELLRNPQKMAKAQLELEHVVGKGGIIQETNISKLPNIQAIVKETYRLHPPTPFLIPYKAEKDVEFCGYLVPKNAHVWVNTSAIGRNPKVWSDPLSFSPERFSGSEINVKGKNFELIPFGAGRRICPGMSLGDRMVYLMLATLLHLFDWKCCDGISPEDIDMEEKFGITLQKAQPLQAIPVPRWPTDCTTTFVNDSLQKSIFLILTNITPYVVSNHL